MLQCLSSTGLLYVMVDCAFLLFLFVWAEKVCLISVAYRKTSEPRPSCANFIFCCCVCENIGITDRKFTDMVVSEERENTLCRLSVILHLCLFGIWWGMPLYLQLIYGILENFCYLWFLQPACLCKAFAHCCFCSSHHLKRKKEDTFSPLILLLFSCHLYVPGTYYIYFQWYHSLLDILVAYSALFLCFMQPSILPLHMSSCLVHWTGFVAWH